MEETTKHGRIGRAAMKADMDRKTARKYVALGKLPSEMHVPRDWRTRADPFEEHWEGIKARLELTPSLEAKTLFELLRDEHPGRYQPGQLRSLQRRIRTWRAASGPEQEVTLAQQHRPGEAAQTDFTNAAELGVTIAGELFLHLLCVMVLPFSNWQWVTVCLSESLAALRKGVQRALFQLGRVPRYHQTDNSTAATHRIPADRKEYTSSKRPFNEDYLAVMRHFGLTARTTEIGAKEQNGDVEAGNRGCKHRLSQALLVRGSRDFASVAEWQAFIDEVTRRANTARGARGAEELAAMRELNVAKLPEYVTEVAQVSEWSTIRVWHCAYSVPSRLMGEALTVRVYEERIEAYYGNDLQLACERLVGRKQRRIDYRHIIWSLVRKPGGFARYVYREEMFPTLIFRRAYDAIQTPHLGTKGDLEYLRILHLAATTMQADVEAALTLLLEAQEPVTADSVKALLAVATATPPPVPELTLPPVDLRTYDALVSAEVAA